MSDGALILMYHRIAVPDTDPWNLCVSPENFDHQIKWLKENYTVVSVTDFIDRLANSDSLENIVCITFDDGYADNYHVAKPILERYDCPATIFIPTAFIESDQSFWWDELEYIFLHLTTVPPHLKLRINELDVEYTINDHTLNADQLYQHEQWRWYDPHPTDRCTVFLELWTLLRVRNHSLIKETIGILREWAKVEAVKNFRIPMSSHEMIDIFNHSLFTPGLHTHTHPDLSVWSKEDQLMEISIGKKIFNETFTQHLDVLAYPYGSYNEQTLAVVNELNLKAAFTTESMKVNHSTNKDALGRVQVCNWNVLEFQHALSL